MFWKPIQGNKVVGGRTLEETQQQSSGQNLAVWMSQLLDKKGGQETTIIDVRGRSSITDFILIVTGTSSRHLQTLIEIPALEMKKLCFPASHIEGNGTHWIIADFGDVLLHVFDEQARRYFNLEELWDSAPRVEWGSKKSAVSISK